MSIAFADITLPLWLVVSQWTLLFALGFLILVMYRQVALLEYWKDRGTERDGLPIGEKAPAFDYIAVNQMSRTTTRFEPGGNWTLLVFADPGCVSCENMLHALEQLAPKLEQGTSVLVVTSAEPVQIDASGAFRTTTVEVSRIHDEVRSRFYRTQVTPFGYLIDPDGIIRAKGAATDGTAIRKIVRQGERSPVNVMFPVTERI